VEGIQFAAAQMPPGSYQYAAPGPTLVVSGAWTPVRSPDIHEVCEEIHGDVSGGDKTPVRIPDIHEVCEEINVDVSGGEKTPGRDQRQALDVQQAPLEVGVSHCTLDPALLRFLSP
jgi:hypothetical protein